MNRITKCNVCGATEGYDGHVYGPCNGELRVPAHELAEGNVVFLPGKFGVNVTVLHVQHSERGRPGVRLTLDAGMGSETYIVLDATRMVTLIK